jgi:hypothetical protein
MTNVKRRETQDWAGFPVLNALLSAREDWSKPRLCEDARRLFSFVALDFNTTFFNSPAAGAGFLHKLRKLFLLRKPDSYKPAYGRNGFAAPAACLSADLNAPAIALLVTPVGACWCIGIGHWSENTRMRRVRECDPNQLQRVWLAHRSAASTSRSACAASTVCEYIKLRLVLRTSRAPQNEHC